MYRSTFFQLTILHVQTAEVVYWQKDVK